MDDSDKNKLKEVLSSIDPIEFKWDEANMSTETGFIAQETGTTIDTIDLNSAYDNISIGPIDLGNITITSASGINGAYLSSNGINGSVYSIGSSQPSIAIANEGGKSYIQTGKSKIDIDELGNMMETLKKRLLILTPSFEMHEKYPMLKEMYDEYKAMERLLGGPDSDE
jgi:hypothetical protein